MKNSPKIIGLVQATALVLYVTAFAVSAQNFQGWMMLHNGKPDNPALTITIFLFAFIISALVSSSCVFAYPIFLFFAGEKRKAGAIIGWNFFWIVLFFITILLYQTAILV